MTSDCIVKNVQDRGVVPTVGIHVQRRHRGAGGTAIEALLPVPFICFVHDDKLLYVPLLELFPLIAVDALNR
jgi:hypothetical protein